MCLSDLIKEAQKMIDAYGDIKVITFRNHECLDAKSIVYVYYANAACVTHESTT